MDLFSVFVIPAGAVILVLGVAVYRGNAKLIHDYHQQRVKEEDLPAYCRGIAKGLFLMGGSLILSGLVNLLGKSGPVLLATLAVFATGIVASLIYIYRVQKKYNGGLF